MLKIKHVKCSMPNCHKTVSQHKVSTNANKTMCEQHRKTRKDEVDAWKLERQCANRDGHYGFKCVCSWVSYAPSLDINHIDGDNSNRADDNIEVLCKMCHTQVTFEQGHHLTTKKSRRAEYSIEVRGLFTGL